MKDEKEEIVIAGGQGQWTGPTQLSSPHGIIVDQLGTLYVADCNNDRVMCWLKETTQGTALVGENGHGKQLNQFHYSMNLSFD